MKKVFITRQIPSIAKDLLSKKFIVDINEKKDGLSKSSLIKIVQDYDVVLSTLSEKLDRSILAHAKKVKAISNYAVGIDNIDVKYARSKNIQVFNLPDIVTNSTAELTFALLLSLIRKICKAERYVKDGLWQDVDPNLFVGEELFGKTFGIIGFGRIGKAVATRALAFGMKVIFYHYRLLEDFYGCLQQCMYLKGWKTIYFALPIHCFR